MVLAFAISHLRFPTVTYSPQPEGRKTWNADSISVNQELFEADLEPCQLSCHGIEGRNEGICCCSLPARVCRHPLLQRLFYITNTLSPPPSNFLDFEVRRGKVVVVVIGIPRSQFTGYVFVEFFGWTWVVERGVNNGS